MKALFLAPSLETGGAERQLVLLAAGLAGRGHDVGLALFRKTGPLLASLPDAVRVHDLGKRGRADLLGFLLRAVRLVRAERPQVLCSFLGVPNLVAAGLKILSPGLRVAWSVRASDMDLNRYGLLHRLCARAEVLLSRVPDRIVANSEAGRNHAVSQGMLADRFTVIPNGIDTETYRPDRGLGCSLREEWGIGEDQMLIGLVARLDPMKDHETFLRAAAQLAAQRADVRFACVGGGDPVLRESQQALGRELGLANRLVWAGARQDMPAVYNALDVLCLSSAYGEGFPNVLGEAMSCGVPCVATDVGDAAVVVGDTGLVVPKGEPAALARGLRTQLERLQSGDEALRAACRERIAEYFSLERMVAAFEDQFGGLLS